MSTFYFEFEKLFFMKQFYISEHQLLSFITTKISVVTKFSLLTKNLAMTNFFQYYFVIILQQKPNARTWRMLKMKSHQVPRKLEPA
jgi:hypothetical protein